MRKGIKVVLVVLILSSLAMTASAGETSRSIAVSCSIPAIPGLNVPLIENQDTTVVSDRWETRDILKEEPRKRLAMLQEEDFNTYTVYAR
ncbi:MAG: hypothetical protein ABH848_02455 [Candidatus Omnitrophota bacterium]